MLIESKGTSSLTSKHDLAYVCFLPPGVVSLFSAVSTVVPMSSGVAGGIGFLVLIPLTIVTLISIPTGIYLSLVYRKDIVLLFLSILTVLRLAEVVTEAGSVAFYNATAWLYGILVLVLEASWFLRRRWRLAAA